MSHRHKEAWTVGISIAVLLGVALLGGCASRPHYSSGYEPGMSYEEVISTPASRSLDGPMAPRYLNGTRANIYDGTPYRDGGVRMNNMINYPDGRVEFVK